MTDGSSATDIEAALARSAALLAAAHERRRSGCQRIEQSNVILDRVARRQRAGTRV
jgi:hypothetical protein